MATQLDLTSPYGYSADAVVVAKAILKLSTEKRRELSRFLQWTTAPTYYSGQEFDQLQQLASLLTTNTGG